ncbi:hypothetical protein JYU14_04010, partial [Simkania negevensis]|nr:hypothetical protein [Simkania negevensis]
MKKAALMLFLGFSAICFSHSVQAEGITMHVPNAEKYECFILQYEHDGNADHHVEVMTGAGLGTVTLPSKVKAGTRVAIRCLSRCCNFAGWLPAQNGHIFDIKG